MVSVFIDLFKYLGIIIGSISGIIGLIVDFKDKETNRITRKGYIILVLIISSAFVSIVLQTFEICQERIERQQASQKELEQENQNTELLTEINRTNRTLNPIKDVCHLFDRDHRYRKRYSDL